MVPKSFNLTGVSHIPNAQENIERYAKVGQTIQLVRDPTNPHDPFATKACIDIAGVPTQIGWIPMKFTSEVAPS